MHSSHSSVLPPTCLLTPMPPPTQPKERITLHRGFNVVSFCFLLASSLVGSSLLAGPMWLEGQEICPGVQVISGPIDLATAPSSFSLESPQGSGILVSQSNELITDVPSFLQKIHTTVVVRSNKNKVSLPFNANLGLFAYKLLLINRYFRMQQITQQTNLPVVGYNLLSQCRIMIFIFLPHRINLMLHVFHMDRMVQIRLMGHIPTRGYPPTHFQIMAVACPNCGNDMSLVRFLQLIPISFRA